MRHQLLILNRGRKRAPNLRAADRVIVGLCALFMRPERVPRSAIVLKPSTLLHLHSLLRRRKYRLLFSPKRGRRSGPKGPNQELIDAVIEMKRRNSNWSCPRIAWRLQALAEGDLSERARTRARELANDADLRVQPSNAFLNTPAAHYGPDRRLPTPGTILKRSFKGRNLEVRILDDGFEFEGRRYQSLSAIASEVAGSRWNGFAFFALEGNARKAGA